MRWDEMRWDVQSKKEWIYITISQVKLNIFHLKRDKGILNTYNKFNDKIHVNQLNKH